jgi:hypothetical protein
MQAHHTLKSLDVLAAPVATLLPEITAVSTRVVITDGTAPITLTLHGRNLMRTGVALIARCRSVQRMLTARPSRNGGSCVDVVLPTAALPVQGHTASVLWLEACVGGYMCAAVPVLVSGKLHVASEAARLSEALLLAPTGGQTAVEALFLSLAYHPVATSSPLAAQNRLPPVATPARLCRAHGQTPALAAQNCSPNAVASTLDSQTACNACNTCITQSRDVHPKVWPDLISPATTTPSAWQDAKAKHVCDERGGELAAQGDGVEDLSAAAWSLPELAAVGLASVQDLWDDILGAQLVA